MTLSNFQPNNELKSVLAIHYDLKKFGAALFHENKIQILTEDSSKINRDLFDMLSLQVSELKVICSTQSNLVALRQCLTQEMTLQVVSSNDFGLCTADELQSEYSVTINHECTFENESCFKSLRALLNYLTRTVELNQITERVELLEIESTSVIVSKNCLQALQIFDFEPHPNMHASNHDFKEGCSIYSLFNHTTSEEGKAKLKSWFQHPTSNIQLLKARQKSIEALNVSDMLPFIKSVSKSLKKCVRVEVISFQNIS